MKGLTDIDYRHAKRVYKFFNYKNFGDYHGLYVQRDTLLLADVFESFRNMCLKEYELDPVYLFSLPRLTWLACLKKTGTKLELLTDPDM